MAATLSTCSSSLPPPPSLGEALESHPPLPLLHASEVLQSSLSIASHVLQLTGAAGQGDDLDDKSWSQGFRFPPPSATFSGRVFAALYCQAAMQVAAGGSPPCARPAPPFRRMARSASPDGESAPGGGDGTEGGSPDAGEERWDWTYGGLLSPAVSRLASRVALAALWGSPDLGPTVGPEELPLLSGAAATARASDVTVHCRGLLIRLPVSATNPSPPQAAPLTSFVQGAGSCIETVEQGGDLRPLGQRGGRRRASAPVRLPPDPKEVPPPSRAVLKGLCPPGLPRGGMQREQDGRSGVQAAKPLTGREALSPLEEGCKPLKPEGKPGNCCGSDQVRMLLAALDEDPSKVLREAEAAGRAAAALPQGRFPTCSARASSRAAANPSAPQAADKRGRAGESRSQTNGWKPPTLRGGVESGKGVKELVVWEHRDAIVQEVWGGRGATCIVGETGCGKSTVVPLLLLWESARRGEKGRVVVAQPRRLAASSLAVRVASTIGQPLGREVGYAIGRERVASRHTKLLFVTTGALEPAEPPHPPGTWEALVCAHRPRMCTNPPVCEGYLLEKLAHAPSWLAGCAHVVLDEAHERSAEADLLALLLKRLGAKRQDEGRSSFPRITVMSATLQVGCRLWNCSAPPRPPHARLARHPSLLPAPTTSLHPRPPQPLPASNSPGCVLLSHGCCITLSCRLPKPVNQTVLSVA